MSTPSLIIKNPVMVTLIKRSEHVIGFSDFSTKTCERLPISNRKYREILKNVTKVKDMESFFDWYKQNGKWFLSDFPTDDFDSMIWESTSEIESQNNIFSIKNIIEACLYRTTYGVAYFSQSLEDWIVYEGKPDKLTLDEIEAWLMFQNKQMGIMPTQYHHFYEQGDTIIYQEHIRDLQTIDKMWQSRLDREQSKQDGKDQSNNPLKQKKDNSFYGRKFKYS